jgi:heat shock protein HslJ
MRATVSAGAADRLASVRAVAVGLAVLLVAGCGSDNPTDAEPASFEGVPWVLVSGLDVPGVDQATPSAAFADGTVGGSTGCNRYTGPYTVDGDSLELGTIATTQMACPPPADAVERAYVAALQRVAGWQVEGDELLLKDSDGAVLLRYDRASPVGSWEATAFLQGDAIASPIVGTAITATFGDDGTLAGSAGCNTYRATYTTSGGEIDISPPAATKKACAEPEGVMEQEAAYLAALPSAVRYRVDGGSLELLAADGTFVVVYARAR